MASIIISATKSLTITDRFPDKNLNEDTIAIGSDGEYKYYSYLFFDISSIPCDASIYNSELVLFKTDNFYNDNSKKFSINPLGDYFSTYTTYDNHPEVEYTPINFYPLTSKVSVSINITPIVSLWVKNRLINKGIILYGNEQDPLIKFGSSKQEDKYLIPFIRISCEHDNYNRDYTEILNKILYEICNLNCCSNQKNVTIRQVRVKGTVAKHAVYDIVVNLEVTRKSSGYKDTYYASDVYDNSLNDKPLFIDKTYNIAVIPKEDSGDTEEVIVYGSYRK